MAEPTHRTQEWFRLQANSCGRLGSPFYAGLLERCADRIASGDATLRAVLAGHEDDPGPSALALRLMGAVHRLVLDGAAQALAATYPSVGGNGSVEQAWPAFVAVLDQHAAAIRASLEHAPQTNEVGRSASLIGGLLRLAEDTGLPIRLREIGSSAGLNLRADHFAVSVGGVHLAGPVGSPVQLADAWEGPLPPMVPLEITDRWGSDISPIDPTHDDGARRLLSYVWPDQTARFERLRGAIEVSRTVPALVERMDAPTAVRALDLARGQVTVLWHSIMWQYLSRADKDAVLALLDELGGEATESAPLAHLSLEPRRRSTGSEHENLVVLRTWPSGHAVVLGSAPAHGVPVRWEPPTVWSQADR
ncbi:MAG: DUF2332 domain-containing protein [Nocardioidaceae bacterium]